MLRLVVLVLYALLMFCRPAGAHPLLQNSMWVLVEPERVQVAVNVSAKELALAEGLKESSDALALEDAAPQHAAYVLRHVRLSAAGKALVGTLSKLTPPPAFGEAEATFFQFEFVFELPKGTAPTAIVFSQDTLREVAYAPGETWDVTYALRLKRKGSEEVESVLLRPGVTLEMATGLSGAPLPDAAQNRARVFGQYLSDGIMHILTGYDHLLFVSALVLATMTFWEMVKVIAAFTAAHTLTLTLAAFNLVRLPGWFVEPVIAASIVFVALENILWPTRTQSKMRLLVAFCFGLIHGLGFAGGLLDAMAGLPKMSLGLAIVAFSLGVEIGHQIVVLPLFGLLRLGQVQWQGTFRAGVLRYGSVVISLLGVWYLACALGLA